jgi:ribosome-binding protein aMBF1 (putative translation factor)
MHRERRRAEVGPARALSEQGGIAVPEDAASEAAGSPLTYGQLRLTGLTYRQLHELGHLLVERTRWPHPSADASKELLEDWERAALSEQIIVAQRLLSSGENCAEESPAQESPAMEGSSYEEMTRRIGRNIFRMRRWQLDISQADLVALMGSPPVRVDRVSRWENGKVRPDDAHLSRLATAFGVDDGWFYAKHADAEFVRVENAA